MSNANTARDWKMSVKGLASGQEETMHEEVFYGTEEEATAKAVQLMPLGDRVVFAAI